MSTFKEVMQSKYIKMAEVETQKVELEKERFIWEKELAGKKIEVEVQKVITTINNSNNLFPNTYFF